MRFQFLKVSLRARGQTKPDLVCELARAVRAQCVLEQSQRLLERILRIRLQRRGSNGGVSPTRGHGERFVVKPRGLVAVQRQPAQQDDAWDGISSDAYAS